ncbi:prepilin peptidase [Protaetiibacter sp. SSC-01]|uniref:prepilin peptidase n=1 Tax=Protaetiibacter sp. SSC-01 TaxID=2759943 RepID=UPI001656DF3C|nr:A24 family peptidase [Protaetiibacter sp. SSC-01]QNO37770.1 prepilin peptidase [Protaetiibacter sp. SSC-01]
MMPLLATVVGVTGLSIGSFLNVVVWRVPRGVSIVRPASACPGCGAEIRARDNVPVLSWLLLGRRCRECRTAISARYPLVEAVTAIAFVVVALVFAPSILEATDPSSVVAASLVLAAYLALAAISIALSAIDLELRRLPNPIVLTGFIAGVALLVPALLIETRYDLLVSAGLGAAASFAFYLALALIGRGGMGMGDVKLAGVLGLYLGALGWAPLVVGVAAAFAVGAVAGVITLIVRRSVKDRSLPFGPWMFLGAWVGIFGGDAIAAGYLRFVGLG